jgi:hypothetical protein
MEPGPSIDVNDENETFRKTDNYKAIGTGIHYPALDVVVRCIKIRWLS